MALQMNEKITQIKSMAQLVRERRTIREFNSKPVSQKLLVELLNDAVWAPNHGNREPWRFILFQGEGRKKFADAVINTFTQDEKEKWGEARYEYYMNIPAHLVVVMKEDPRAKQWEEDFSATSAMIQNFLLVAWERDLGVVWKTNAYNSDPRFHKVIGINPGEKIVGTLHIGYFDKTPKGKPRTKVEDKLTIIE